ncbi:hypothetical protein GGI22_001803, partial [Coemansia erecta]
MPAAKESVASRPIKRAVSKLRKSPADSTQKVNDPRKEEEEAEQSGIDSNKTQDGSGSG